MTIFLFVFGLVFLIIGAEILVRGASQIAQRMGIPPLIVGLTVVAFGTSAPELAVSIKSALSAQADIAVGNIIGSNIFNILFILGLSALIIPLRVSQQLIRLDVPLMIGLSAMVLLFSLDHNISRTNGLILVIGLVAYLVYLFYQGQKENADTAAEKAREISEVDGQIQSNWTINIGLVLGGLLLLVIGSRWLVDSAVTFAQFLGVNELIIGLTIVSAGTSLPEVVTSIIAAVRGERDIAVGNIVGSNIFNIMAVLGLTSIIAPTGIEVSNAVIGFDLPIMIAVALASLPIFFTGGIISRWEGGLFLGYYMAYTLYLVLAATHHATLSLFSTVMLYFVIPITLFTIITIVVQQLRKNNQVP
ncbi:calcium/sodium antiporter [Aliifodinibius salicampi]|uniref:Calcium/sodium antiporter n=1 Tax=Fodinibius salicampi TaxID=1920655 RepID=A0ABT3Q054_9BACT|nr:calcium/sodium antiporter [Fodinibius salicampi]MCW9713498.1 calcium/sodium antiporter [Fodinibius salicampi]